MYGASMLNEVTGDESQSKNESRDEGTRKVDG